MTMTSSLCLQPYLSLDLVDKIYIKYKLNVKELRMESITDKSSNNIIYGKLTYKRIITIITWKQVDNNNNSHVTL